MNAGEEQKRSDGAEPDEPPVDGPGTGSEEPDEDSEDLGASSQGSPGGEGS